DHLAVEQKPPVLLARDRFAHLRVSAGEILGCARLQPHLAAVLVRDAALAIELALEQPVRPELATVGEGRQHQRERHGCNRPSSSFLWAQRPGRGHPDAGSQRRPPRELTETYS